jgi:hypothetical protein
MNRPITSKAAPRQTPLEAGLRRFAPKRATAPRVALLDFAVAVLLAGWERGAADSGPRSAR